MERQRILKKNAEILGAADEEIEKTDEIIAATEKLKRGLMQQLFTRGIGHTKFKRTFEKKR
jgi:type I restriction enzyme S subunit